MTKFKIEKGKLTNYKKFGAGKGGGLIATIKIHKKNWQLFTTSKKIGQYLFILYVDEDIISELSYGSAQLSYGLAQGRTKPMSKDMWTH